VKTYEILVSGRVQKVGFRACIKKIAMNLGIAGETTNLPDGRVRIVATAESIVLEKFISMLYSCNRVIIRDLQVFEFGYTDFKEFSIVRQTI
jgi:acylphosphatase